MGTRGQRLDKNSTLERSEAKENETDTLGTSGQKLHKTRPWSEAKQSEAKENETDTLGTGWQRLDKTRPWREAKRSKRK